MKRLKSFLIIFLLHLALTYFVGLSSALSLGGNPLWMKIVTWIIKFPCLILANYFFPDVEIEKSSELWNDPFTYAIFLNSLLWAFVVSSLLNRFLHSRKK
jgi:hypothetical protein